MEEISYQNVLLPPLKLDVMFDFQIQLAYESTFACHPKCQTTLELLPLVHVFTLKHEM